MPEKILVVDDEPFILRSLGFVLEHDPEPGALEKLRDERPRLVILDVMMPKRNGYEVCEIVKGDPDLRDTYVILLTAKGQESAKDRGVQAGADEYMTKPFSPSRIVERVLEILSGTPSDAVHTPEGIA